VTDRDLLVLASLAEGDKHGYATMDGFAAKGLISSLLCYPCVDNTGLDGVYEVKLDIDRTGFTLAPGNEVDGLTAIVTALRNQLCLKLKRTRTAVDVLVIEHVEKAVRQLTDTKHRVLAVAARKRSENNTDRRLTRERCFETHTAEGSSSIDGSVLRAPRAPIEISCYRRDAINARASGASGTELRIPHPL
jgi:hypothetical protein